MISHLGSRVPKNNCKSVQKPNATCLQKSKLQLLCTLLTTCYNAAQFTSPSDMNGMLYSLIIPDSILRVVTVSYVNYHMKKTLFSLVKLDRCLRFWCWLFFCFGFLIFVQFSIVQRGPGCGQEKPSNDFHCTWKVNVSDCNLTNLHYFTNIFGKEDQLKVVL